MFIFQGCTMVWFYELHYKEKIIQCNMLCYTLKWVIHWYFKFWVAYLLSGTCRQKLSVEWHWLKFLLSRFFCISISFISTADKFVTNGERTGQTLPIHQHWMDLQGMQSMVLAPWIGQIWLGTPPVVLQFILVFFHFIVYNCLFAKNIRSH